MNNCTLSNAIVACLTYFDIFQHPLRKEELHNFLRIPISIPQLEQSLQNLLASKSIYLINGYYLLQNDASRITDRLVFEKNADEKIELALKYGQLIQKFPFIKATLISGSLSKHIMREDSDIDFFIISKANRIWISKLFLKIYKILFLGNSKEHFCINYFIAEADLYIKEQNTFTATELATLIPIGCEAAYQNLLKENEWYKAFLPNYAILKRKSLQVAHLEKPLISKGIQQLFFGKWGDHFDTFIMKLHAYRNKKKYVGLTRNKDFELMLRATKSQIKVHPPNHQNVTLRKYRELVEKLTTETN